MGMYHHTSYSTHSYFPDEEIETQRVKDLPRVKPSQLWTAVIVSRIVLWEPSCNSTIVTIETACCLVSVDITCSILLLDNPWRPSLPFVLFKTKVIKFLWARAAKIYSLCQKIKWNNKRLFFFPLEKKEFLFSTSHILRAGLWWEVATFSTRKLLWLSGLATVQGYA